MSPAKVILMGHRCVALLYVCNNRQQGKAASGEQKLIIKVNCLPLSKVLNVQECDASKASFMLCSRAKKLLCIWWSLTLFLYHFLEIYDALEEYFYNNKNEDEYIEKV